MEYYVIRIYRREERRGGGRETQLTGLLEDGEGHQETFRNAEELWRLLARSVLDDAPVEPEHGG